MQTVHATVPDYCFWRAAAKHAMGAQSRKYGEIHVLGTLFGDWMIVSQKRLRSEDAR